jgi:Uma2 family endonuclease
VPVMTSRQFRAVPFRQRERTAIISALSGQTPMAIRDLELQSRPPLTVEEFEALAETEGWNEDTRVELLDGEIVWMSPINDPHAACVKRLNRLFSRLRR